MAGHPAVAGGGGPGRNPRPCAFPWKRRGPTSCTRVIAPEPKFQAQLIYQTAVIMDVAGVNWTMPASGVGWDNSDMAMFTGRQRNHGAPQTRPLRNRRTAAGEKNRHGRMRSRLPQSVYDMGNRWLGWSMPPFTIVHAIEFYHDLIKAAGQNQNRQKVCEQPITLHDPCNVVRGGGLHAEGPLRGAMRCVKSVIEMVPNREHNYCCCAGGGVINTGPPFKMTRIDGNKRQGRTALRRQDQAVPKYARGTLPQLPQRPARHRAPL
jgi:hypothetical protein